MINTTVSQGTHIPKIFLVKMKLLHCLCEDYQRCLFQVQIPGHSLKFTASQSLGNLHLKNNTLHITYALLLRTLSSNRFFRTDLFLK